MRAATLTLFGVRGDLADRFAGPLTDAMSEYEINTKDRMAAFMAQILHESGMLRYTKEIWGPSAAQVRYEGRKDLGNTEPGDGKRFMGRGLIQTTGRNNYKNTGDALGIDLLSNPEMLETTILATRSAGWFWKNRGLNELADSGKFETITRRINGGINGLEDRERLFDIARRVFSD